MKTLSRRIATKTSGVFYKEIISDTNSVIDKVFIVRYKDINGRDKLTTIGKFSEGIREAYCKAKLNEIKHKIIEGDELPKIARKKSNITYDELAEIYFDTKEKEDHRDPKKEKARYTNHIKKIIGNYLPENITKELLLDMQNNFKKKLSPRTTNHLMFITTAILKHAIEIKKYIGVIPSIKGLTLDNARERYLELEEIKQLIDESKKEAYHDIWLFIKLSLSTGARFTSVLSIKKKDIKLSTGTINIKDFKSNKTYQAYISDTELFNYLENHMKTINLNDTIISVKKNIIQTRLTPILNRLFNDGLEKDDRKNRTVIHTLRHTFASHLAINGTPIFTIQKLMNHKLIEMTMRYAHLAPDSGSNAVKDLYK